METGNFENNKIGTKNFNNRRPCFSDELLAEMELLNQVNSIGNWLITVFTKSGDRFDENENQNKVFVCGICLGMLAL